MPHVDDGTLHALLDGALRAESPERASEVEAHLAACGDCRARLEAAEELRGEASGILDAAIAEDLGAIPDFSDVVRRAEAPAPNRQPGAHSGRQPGRRRRQARWTRGVAWAASLVLALGTGYLIRDLAGPPGGDAASRRIGTEAVESAPSRGQGPAAEEVADRGAGVAGEGEAPVDGAPAAPTGAAPTGAAPTEPPPSGRASTERGPTEQAATDQAAAAPAAALERRAAADGQADAAAKAVEPEEPPVAGAPEPAAEGAPAAAAVDERVEVVEISPTTFERAATRWSAITVEEAREILDGPVYLLPRAELLDLYTRADAEQRQVLSLQRLQTGVPIQVLQWRGEDEEPEVTGDRIDISPSPGRATPARHAALSDAALPDANVVRVVRDEFVLELTGSLPAALLLVLGETADPAR